MSDAKPKKPRKLVKCPICEATSRVNFTMGGVQERTCRNGHIFTYDKWMADRLIWAPGAIGGLTKPGGMF